MNELILFLKNNWQLIAAVVIFILSFILQLIKKKPINDIMTYIYSYVCKAVNDVENEGVEGSILKKSCATQIVLKMLAVHFPDLKLDQYLGVIQETIELVLSTPSKKKGGSVDGK